jgi:hypothetical protein
MFIDKNETQIIWILLQLLIYSGDFFFQNGNSYGAPGKIDIQIIMYLSEI